MRGITDTPDTSSTGQGEPPVRVTQNGGALQSDGSPRPAARPESHTSGRSSNRPPTNGTSPAAPPASPVVFVGEARIDLETWEISRQGRQKRLPEKPFRVLEALIERPGELVSRTELNRRLWPDGTIVDFDNNLNSAVASLRTALGDTAKAPRVIETLPRLGYRLIAELRFEDAPEPASSEPARRGGFGRRVLAFAIAVLLFLVAAGVRQSLKGRGAEPVTAATPSSNGSMMLQKPEARQAWQTGLYLLERGAVGDLTMALESFEEARSLEPLFAPVHEKIAETSMRMGFSGGLELRDALTRCREAAQEAHRLDPHAAGPYRLEALADLHLEWNFEAAAAGLESALQLGPEDAENYLAAATFVAAAGHAEAAVQAARRAVDLDPVSVLLKADLGYFLIAAGRFSEALALSDELLELEPDSITLLGSRQIAAERLGLYERSLAAAQRIMELRGADPMETRALAGVKAQVGLIRFRTWRLENLRANDSPSFFYLALRQAALHRNDAALENLHRAYEAREPWLIYLRSYPQFDVLKTDPRFTAFLSRLGFPGPADPVVARVENRL